MIARLRRWWWRRTACPYDWRGTDMAVPKAAHVRIVRRDRGRGA